MCVCVRACECVRVSSEGRGVTRLRGYAMNERVAIPYLDAVHHPGCRALDNLRRAVDLRHGHASARHDNVPINDVDRDKGRCVPA